MTWTRLSDTFADSPAVLPLSDAAFRLHVTALVWCNKQLTDGAVPARAVRLLTAEPDPGPLVHELLASQLWAEDGPNYLIDWSDQETAQSVQTRAQAHAARNREYRSRVADRQARHALGDHSKCDRCTAVRDASRDASRDDPPTRARPEPDPTVREGRAKGEAAGAANAAEVTAGSRSASPAVTSAAPMDEGNSADVVVALTAPDLDAVTRADQLALLHDLETLGSGDVLPAGYFDLLPAPDVGPAILDALAMVEDGTAHGCILPLDIGRPELWAALVYEPVRAALREHCERDDLFAALAALVEDVAAHPPHVAIPTIDHDPENARAHAHRTEGINP